MFGDCENIHDAEADERAGMTIADRAREVLLSVSAGGLSADDVERIEIIECAEDNGADLGDLECAISEGSWSAVREFVDEQLGDW